MWNSTKVSFYKYYHLITYYCISLRFTMEFFLFLFLVKVHQNLIYSFNAKRNFRESSIWKIFKPNKKSWKFLKENPERVSTNKIKMIVSLFYKIVLFLHLNLTKHFVIFCNTASECSKKKRWLVYFKMIQIKKQINRTSLTYF